MDKQKLMPQAAQPINRMMTGQLPAELAELSEEVLQLHGDLSASLYILSEDNCGGDASCGGSVCNLCKCASCICAGCGRGCSCLE